MKVLVVEDEASLRLGISRMLQRAGHTVSATETGAEGVELLRKTGYDVVITDLMLPDMNGIAVLKAIKDISPDTGAIVITAYANVKTAVEAMRAGAYDYLSKPFDPDELFIVLERYISHKQLETDNELLRQELDSTRPFQSIIGSAPAMQEIFETIKRVAGTGSTVIILGETGTGKELVANAIHALSPRKAKPFIKINCAAIPETLLESELFGHEKGAFTGALQRRKGKFELAHGGTILFDEIGDMPATVQAKLLRVLETLTFERLGGHESIAVDVRMLFATRRNLEDEIKAGRFREDLFYRINVLPIMLPPLRDRREDIEELAREFLNLFCVKNGVQKIAVQPEAMRLLKAYDYPGNVRELKHALEMAAILRRTGSIAPEDLPSRLRGKESLSPAVAGGTLEEHVKQAERAIIARTLEDAKGKKWTAAARLGISRKTLWRKLREHDFPSNLLESED